MNKLVIALCGMPASAIYAQAIQPQPFDFSPYALKSDVQAATSIAANAQSVAQTAMTNAAVANSLAQTVVQPSALSAAAAANLTLMQQQAPTFVNNGTFMATAALLNQYPCATGILGKLAHVSDLYGNVSSTLVCETSAGSFYWRPQRTDYANAMSVATGSASLIPLATAPVVYLTATPTSTVTLNLSTTNVWPGASFHIYAPATIGTLGAVNISGLVGGGTVPLAQGSDKVVTYIPGNGWKSN